MDLLKKDSQKSIFEGRPAHGASVASKVWAGIENQGPSQLTRLGKETLTMRISKRFFALVLPLLLAAALPAQEGSIDLPDNGSEVFDSSTANKTYQITNKGPDTSIRIYRRAGQHGEWTLIATLGLNEVHTVTPDAGDQLKAVDLNDADSNGATVEWKIFD